MPDRSPTEKEQKDQAARDREQRDMERQGYTKQHSKEVAEKRVPHTPKKH